MKLIALVSVIGILLLQLSGAIPPSSVGGPMVIAVAFLLAALAVGIHEAWSKKRGLLGWIVSIVVSVAGALLATAVLGDVLAILLSLVFDLKGSIASSGGPAAYVALALMMIVALCGSWGALWSVSRWR